MVRRNTTLPREELTVNSRQLTVQGKTKTRKKLTVNSRQLTVQENSKFETRNSKLGRWSSRLLLSRAEDLKVCATTAFTSRRPEGVRYRCFLLSAFWKSRRVTRRTLRYGCFLLSAFCLLPSAWAQDLAKDALTSFPPQTIRLEYARPAKLRKLPDYENLRQRYVAPNLQNLEASLSKLGIGERDIDELVLGWQANAKPTDLEGLAAGHFDSSAMAKRAAVQNLAPVPVAGLRAYCLGSEPASTCVVVLGKTRGAFGPLSSLTTMLQARNEGGASISSDTRFTTLVKEAHMDAPIWGIAIGQGVTDWFKGWMPGQNEIQLEWSKTFQTVETLFYSVETAEKVHLNVKLACTSPEAAVNLRQIFEGLKLFQQLAWQNQNPNRPNPFEALVVDASGRQVFLTLTTAYAALEDSR